MKTRARRFRQDDESLTAGAPPPIPVYARWTAFIARDNTEVDRGFRWFGTFTWRDGKPALKQLGSNGHVDGSNDTIVGHVEQFSKVEGMNFASGVFYDDMHGRKAAQLAVDGGPLSFISCEAAEAEQEIVEDDDGMIVQIRFPEYMIGALAQVDKPGFPDTGFLTIEIVEDEMVDSPMSIAASGVDGHLGDHDQLDDYTEAEDWGFNFLVASSMGSIPEYKSTAFGLPECPHPMPLTVFEDMSFAGHLAVYDTCHIAFADKCVRPPKSHLSYTPAHQGNVRLDDGNLLRVARISIGSNHAPSNLNPRATADFYERDSLCAGFATCLDGEIGIWVRGHVNLEADQSVINRFASAAWSGDWRSIRRHLELVGILSVNIPGFPIPDAKAWQEGRETKALVASGARSVAKLDRTVPLQWAREKFSLSRYVDPEAEAKRALLDRTAKSLGLPTAAEHRRAQIAAAAERAGVMV